MYNKNEIIENIYFIYLKAVSKVIGVYRYSATAITLRYSVRYYKRFITA